MPQLRGPGGDAKQLDGGVRASGVVVPRRSAGGSVGKGLGVDDEEPDEARRRGVVDAAEAGHAEEAVAGGARVAGRLQDLELEPVVGGLVDAQRDDGVLYGAARDIEFSSTRRKGLIRMLLRYSCHKGYALFFFPFLFFPFLLPPFFLP